MTPGQWLVLQFCSFAAASSLGGSVAALAKAPAPPLPRYQLSVGQELVYRSHGWSKHTNGEARYETFGSCQFQVVASLPNGGWHLIEETSEGSSEDALQPGELVCFDLMPDGTLAMDADMKRRCNPAVRFPPLPHDTAALSAGWAGPPDLYGETVRYHLAAAATQPSDPSQINFVGVQSGLLEDVYQWQPVTTFHFDPQRGLISGSSMHCDEAIYKATEDSTTQLQSSQQHPPAWASAFAAHVQLFFDARQRYIKAMEDADTAGDASDDRMAANLRILRTARGQLSDPAVLGQVARLINRHSGWVQEIKDDASQTKLVGQPAPNWDLPDMAGVHHSLSALRGQVVVIDFWYRTCGWCMRAMPSMKRLADEYKGKPVAFFGMNVDADPKDAQFVVDYFKLPYPTLRTRFAPREGDPTTKPADMRVPAATYHVDGYPTLFVIGPDGIIRKMDVGYSPTKHDDLAKEIDTLLVGSGAVSSATR